MRRLWVFSVKRGEVLLDRDESHYARDVLRLQVGRKVVVLDGTGASGVGVIARVERDGVALRIDDVQGAPQEPWSLVLGVAIPRQGASDWLVEKLVELGCSRLVWIETERSLQKRGENRQSRWERVAQAASRQCRRVVPMDIEGPVPFDEFISRAADVKWVGEPDGPTPHDMSLPHRGVVHGLIGPEGGLTEIELKAAKDAGYDQICVSPHVLRVETAALAMAAVVGAMLDDER
jgi:16S rRNA (uracil1498-N3)-methyltransferase